MLFSGCFSLFFANEIKCNSQAADLSVWTSYYVKREVSKRVYIQSRYFVHVQNCFMEWEVQGCYCFLKFHTKC